MYAEVAAYTKAGNFGDFIWGNITLGQKASLLWAVNAGRFFQTAGLFLLGFSFLILFLLPEDDDQHGSQGSRYEDACRDQDPDRDGGDGDSGRLPDAGAQRRDRRSAP